MSAPPYTFRTLADHYGRLLEQEGISQSNRTKPSTSQSDSSKSFVKGHLVTVAQWRDVPVCPDTFLDWPIQYPPGRPITFPFAYNLNSGPLAETQINTGVIHPGASALAAALPSSFNVNNAIALQVVTQRKSTSYEDGVMRITSTSPDIAWQDKRAIADVQSQGGFGYNIAVAENKRPLGAISGTMTSLLDQWFGKTLAPENRPDGLPGAGSHDILTQVSETLYNSKSRFGVIMAAPYLIRHVYLRHESDNRFTLYLSANVVQHATPQTQSEADRLFGTWEPWAHCFHHLAWVQFCIWVTFFSSETQDIQNIVPWQQWGPLVALTMCPGEPIVQPYHRRFKFVRALGYGLWTGLWTGLIDALKLSMLTTLFILFGPSTAFFFISSFQISAIHVSSVINAQKPRNRIFHVTLVPEYTLYRQLSVVCIYRRWGFVVKYGMQQDKFDHECHVHGKITHLSHIPTIIAKGSTTTGIPFLVTTYCGAPVDTLDLSDAHDIHENIIKPMHAAGWHHHDLKKDNITRDKNGKLYIIDFDMADTGVRCASINDVCPDICFLQEFGFEVGCTSTESADVIS